MSGMYELMMAIVAAVICGLGIVYIIGRMIDGDLPVPLGIIAIGAAFPIIGACIAPPHPWVPPITLLILVTLLVFFPFAEHTLERIMIRSFDVELLERSYNALQARPDNFAPVFEIAKSLYDQGFKLQAIGIVEGALNRLSAERDPVSNRSMRDFYSKEESRMRHWKRTMQPGEAVRVACPECRTVPPDDAVLCPKCGSPFLLHAAKSLDPKKKVVGKLILAWSAIAAFLVIACAVGLTLKGPWQIVVFVSALIGVGVLLAWLFKPPTVKGKFQQA